MRASVLVLAAILGLGVSACERNNDRSVGSRTESVFEDTKSAVSEAASDVTKESCEALKEGGIVDSERATWDNCKKRGLLGELEPHD